MPLSEREQRILDEIEKNLHEEYPRLAREIGKPTPFGGSGRHVKMGALVCVIGFAILIAFFVSRVLVVGVVAFATMVGGIVLVAGSLRELASTGRSGRARIARFFSDWEQRIRERYKKT